MPTLENKRLSRWLQIAAFLMPVLAVVSLFNSQMQKVQTVVTAAPPVAQAEKKVTIEGVDSTRINYDLDDESPDAGVFKSHPTDDDIDVATGSKIKTVRVLRQDGSVFPNGTRNCASQNCAVDVNTNSGAITVRDAGNNTVALSYSRRQSYRYSCRRRAVHSRQVKVQSVRLSNPNLTINCPSNKCSAEITYTAQ